MLSLWSLIESHAHSISLENVRFQTDENYLNLKIFELQT